MAAHRPPYNVFYCYVSFHLSLARPLLGPAAIRLASASPSALQHPPTLTRNREAHRSTSHRRPPLHPDKFYRPITYWRASFPSQSNLCVQSVYTPWTHTHAASLWCEQTLPTKETKTGRRLKENTNVAVISSYIRTNQWMSEGNSTRVVYSGKRSREQTKQNRIIRHDSIAITTRDAD